MGIDHELLLERGARSVSCYTTINDPLKKHYLSGSSFDAVGDCCVKRKVFWRHDLPQELTTNSKAELGDLHHHGQLVRVTGNGCDGVGHALISWREAGRDRGPDTDERRYP